MRNRRMAKLPCFGPGPSRSARLRDRRGTSETQGRGASEAAGRGTAAEAQAAAPSDDGRCEPPERGGAISGDGTGIRGRLLNRDRSGIRRPLERRRAVAAAGAPRPRSPAAAWALGQQSPHAAAIPGPRRAPGREGRRGGPCPESVHGRHQCLTTRRRARPFLRSRSPPIAPRGSVSCTSSDAAGPPPAGRASLPGPPR